MEILSETSFKTASACDSRGLKVTCFWSRWLYNARLRVRDFWPCEFLTTIIVTTDVTSYLFIAFGILYLIQFARFQRLPGR